VANWVVFDNIVIKLCWLLKDILVNNFMEKMIHMFLIIEWVIWAELCDLIFA